MFYVIMGLIFFGVPVGAIALFVSSLISYREAKRDPEVEAGELKKKKIRLILASVTAFVLVTTVVGFAVTLYLAIAFM